MQCNAIRTTTVRSEGGSESAIYSINSCIGCGEIPYYPPLVRDAIAKSLDLQQALSDAKYKLVYEDFDTPAINSDDIVDVCAQIAGLPSNQVPIIVAHHNLLPQTLLRVEVYTEMINSGAFRSALSRCEKPIIYCHGHIHQDPIEVISWEDNKYNPLVCISAPALLHGFNLVTLEYCSDEKPIGCVVEQYSIHEDGVVRRKREVRIPLATKEIEVELTKNLKERFLDRIPGCGILFCDYVRKYNRLRIRKIQKITLADRLLEAEWIGLIEINNKESKNFDHWHIMRNSK